ncbi:MAG: hypothetical protein JRM85_07990 [Nitrososphaerota archaeon]|nr:hypothetical protein [Nitrososphaerota archaeon]
MTKEETRETQIRFRSDELFERASKLADKLQVEPGNLSELYRQVFKAGLESMEGGKPSDTVTSDGQHMIKDGQLYELQSFRPGGPGAWVKFDPSRLRQRAQGDTWKRDIAEQKLAMEKEAHQADMLIKKVHVLKLQKRYAPETVPQRCKVPGCPVAGVVFANMDALNAHLKEYHPDRYDGRNQGITYSQGVWFQGGQPVLKWNGAVQ